MLFSGDPEFLSATLHDLVTIYTRYNKIYVKTLRHNSLHLANKNTVCYINVVPESFIYFL